MLQTLPIALPQGRAGNTFKKILKEMRIYSLSQSK